MIFDKGSMMFNTFGGGTPPWGTALGQGEGHRITYKNYDVVVPMVYRAIADKDKVYCPLGKGGNGLEKGQYELTIAALFEKVYFNEKKIDDANFILVIVRELTTVHVGRQTLKYNPKITYRDENINEQCISKLIKAWNIKPEAAFVIYGLDIINQDELHFYGVVIDAEKAIRFDNEVVRNQFIESKQKEQKQILKCLHIGNWKTLERNRILFGAPGTGKSHKLEEEKDALLGIKKDDKGNIIDNGIGAFERVTFHPDYSYAQFVGTYKPVSYGEDNNKKIKYEFVPGPFARVLIKALKNIIDATDANGAINATKVKPFLLIIEELNRAKTAAVFGDVFQLLDRKNGVSEYEIETSQDLRKYLANELGVSDDAVATIKIPDNMFIWATMNSADQGVFPLDTAFKRRWSFEYIDVDNAEEKNDIEFMGIKWNALRKAINDVLSGDDVKAHEDKLLGAFFIKFGDNQNDNDKVKVFCDKVLMYLFDDVVRSKRDKIFNIEKVNIYRFSTVIDGFQKEGINIFKQSVIEAYKKHCSTETEKKE